MTFQPARSILTLVTMALVSTACGGGEQEAAPPSGAATEAEAMEQLASGKLSPEEIRALMERYPRLGTEPLPEPRPSSDASPADVPEDIAAAAPPRVLETATGEASFYADKFEGRRTASGIPFRQNQMVAAHRGYPFGTVLRVVNTRNDRAVNVRVVDRGPFGKQSRILDLSRRAAQELGYVSTGRAQVRVEVLEWGDGVA